MVEHWMSWAPQSDTNSFQEIGCCCTGLSASPSSLHGHWKSTRPRLYQARASRHRTSASSCMPATLLTRHRCKRQTNPTLQLMLPLVLGILRVHQQIQFRQHLQHRSSVLSPAVNSRTAETLRAQGSGRRRKALSRRTKPLHGENEM